VEEAFAADALAQSINAFLAACSEDRRNIFVRRYWYFDTVAEISKKYGYSQSKVKTALFRMREGLKQHLEKEGYAV
jgi:RNA polymerase sigma-70 factor (ECF subfamily)